MSVTHTTVSAIAAEIQGYLVDHPQAADTAVGVQRWWLSDALLGVSLDEVEEALALLERRGVVMSRIVLGDSVVFSARSR